MPSYTLNLLRTFSFTFLQSSPPISFSQAYHQHLRGNQPLRLTPIVLFGSVHPAGKRKQPCLGADDSALMMGCKCQEVHEIRIHSSEHHVKLSTRCSTVNLGAHLREHHISPPTIASDSTISNTKPTILINRVGASGTRSQDMRKRLVNLAAGAQHTQPSITPLNILAAISRCILVLTVAIGNLVATRAFTLDLEASPAALIRTGSRVRVAHHPKDL